MNQDHMFEVVGIASLLLDLMTILWMFENRRRPCKRYWRISQCMLVAMAGWIFCGGLFFALVGLFMWHELLGMFLLWMYGTHLWMSHDKHGHEYKEETE